MDIGTIICLCVFVVLFIIIPLVVQIGDDTPSTDDDKNIIETSNPIKEPSLEELAYQEACEKYKKSAEEKACKIRDEICKNLKNGKTTTIVFDFETELYPNDIEWNTTMNLLPLEHLKRSCGRDDDGVRYICFKYKP
jgi:hypothetical protein